MFRLTGLAVLLLAPLCAARVAEFFVEPLDSSLKPYPLMQDMTITLSPPVGIVAMMKDYLIPDNVTFTSPFRKFEKAEPFSLAGDFPLGNLTAVSLAHGNYRVTAFDSLDPNAPASVPFRVFSKPMVGPLSFPPTFKGATAVLRADANMEETKGPLTYQWELVEDVSMFSDKPMPIKGATGRTLTLPDVRCENVRCDKTGCFNLRRYTVQVCDSISCARSNAVPPFVVRSKGGPSVCPKMTEEYNTRLERALSEATIAYPRTELGGTAVLTARVDDGSFTADVETGHKSYQWEVTRFGFGTIAREPEPIPGATGKTLTIASARCEKASCSRHGCSGLLRYSVRVCNYRGCVRSNAGVPDVVAGKTEAARKKFAAADCWVVSAELEPLGEPRRGAGGF